MLENSIRELECLRLYDEYAGGGSHIELHAGKPGTLDELRHINRETGIPLLFDIAHYRVNPLEQNLSAREIVSSFLDTWKGASTLPVLHYSTIKGNVGTHLSVDPDDFWGYMDQLSGLDFDVMLETKEKERDVLKVKAYSKENTGVMPVPANYGRQRFYTYLA